MKQKMDSIFYDNKHSAKDICFHAESMETDETVMNIDFIILIL